MKILQPIMFLVLLQAGGLAHARAATIHYVAGMDLYLTGWNGNNGAGDDFSSNNSQLGFNFQLKRAKWYAGVTLVDGRYGFSGTKPILSQQNSNYTQFTRREFDLVLGYQALRWLSVFMDLKGIQYRWQEFSNEAVNFNALGIGGQWHHVLNVKWLLFGHFSYAAGDVEQKSVARMGTGSGVSVSLGASYYLTPRYMLSARLKSQNLQYTYQGGKQIHGVGGLVLGFHYLF